MTTTPDPGYTVHDDPWDDFQSTRVPLRTPLGPVTLHFLTDSEVFMVSGYETGEYQGGQAYGNTTDEAFTWKGAEITGSQNFRRVGDAWLPLTDKNFPCNGYGSVHFSARHGRNVTDLMARGIAAYWAAIVTRYAAEHPLIPAHAALRRATRQLDDQEKAIREAEQELARMRGARARIRRDVRRTFFAERTASEPDIMCWPLAYSRETLNGYVLELSNDADLNRKITETQLSRRTYQS